MKKNDHKFDVLWAKQFTKRILVLAFIVWVFGGIYGIVYETIRLLTVPEYASIDGLLIYFAVPLTCGLPSYIIPNLFLKQKQVEYGFNPECPHYENTYESTVSETIVE